MMNSTCFSDVLFRDCEFLWNLRHIGLLFDSEDVVYKSKTFKTLPAKGQEGHPLTWQLVARCWRQCPASMLRVYIRLVSLNDSKVRGKFGIRSYFDQEFPKKKGNFEYGLKYNLDAIEPSDEGDDSEKGIFVGWAGTVTEAVNKIVEAKIRVFHFYGDGIRLERRLVQAEAPAITTLVRIEGQKKVLELDAKMKAFINLLYSKFLENIKLELKRRDLEIVNRKPHLCSSGTQTNEEVDWHAVSMQIIAKVLEFVCNRKQIHKVQYFNEPCPKSNYLVKESLV